MVRKPSSPRGSGRGKSTQRKTRRARGKLGAWFSSKIEKLHYLAQHEPETVWFVVVILAAALLRLWQPDWYFERQFHPDERWIAGVVSQLSYPAEPAGLQYGTFPLYLLSLIKDLAAMVMPAFGHFDPNRFTIWAGRMLSGVFDLITLVFTYLLGLRLFPKKSNPRVWGLLAAIFLSFTVLHIQMAHFFVVDVPLAMLVVATLYWAMGIAQTGSRRDYVLAGVCIGLAMATKTSALPLAVPIGIAHLLGLQRLQVAEARQRWMDLGLAMALSLATFLVAMPHAVLDWDKFWINQNEQRRMLVTGAADVPFNRQYLHTLPFLYYMKNLIRYTMGIPLGLISLGALVVYPVWLAGRAASALFQKQRSVLKSLLERETGWMIVLSFALVYFMVIGVSFAKFNRYLLPLTPLLCLLAARVCLDIYTALAASWLRKLWKVAMGVVVLWTIGWALAFSSIYQHEHPWIAASRWIYQNLPDTVVENGTIRPLAILNEEWGDDLPTYVKDAPAKRYVMNKFPVQEPDTPRKREIILRQLQQNHLIVMADTRAHAVYRRLPERYPINAAYYELMFEQKLGFHLAAEISNYPTLLGKVFPDDRADESFTLYDHPHVYLFLRQDSMLPEAELAKRLDARIAEIKTRVEPRVPQSAGPAKPAAPAGGLPTVVNANIGQPHGQPVFLLGRVNSFTAALAWVLLIEVVGLLSLPLCLSLYSRLPDSGVALSKIVGTLILTWTTWLLVSLGLVPHLQSTTLLVLVVLGGVSIFWAMQRRTELEEFVRTRGVMWATAELVFLVAFVGYMLTKMYNPDIKNPFGQGYNGGGEPMGISFFTAVYQSVHFPPYDPWLSGYPINYYYFGQVILGILAKLIGVPPAWSYQITISLLFALTFTGVYGLGVGLTGKRRWGLVAAVAAAMLGNLHAYFYMLEPLNRGINWSDLANSLGRWGAETWRHIGRFEFIWNPTRLIKGTINEMPWFSFLYGDLHAHIIAIPYSLPLIGWGLNLLLPANSRTALMPEAPGRTGTERGLSFFVTALTLGALSAINTWNFPPYALLVLGVLVIHAFQQHPGRAIPWPAIGTAVLAWLRLVVGGLLLLFFFHKNFKPQSTSLAWVNPAVRTTLKDFLVFFGLPVIVMMTVWAQDLAPQAQKHLAKLGWTPRSRKSWWQRVQQLGATLWNKKPQVVYIAASLVLGFFLLAMFEQLLLGVLVLMLLLAFLELIWRPLSPSLRMAALLIVLGLCVVFGCEIVHVRDFMGVGGDMSRMNTVFKFYMVVWIYLALGLAAGLSQIFSGRREEQRIWRRLFGQGNRWQLYAYTAGVLGLWAAANYFQENSGTPWLTAALAAGLLILPWIWAWWPKADDARRIWAGVLGATVVAVSLYPPISLYNRMRLCSEFKRPTLNGMAYLDFMRPKEVKALAWINRNILRTDIVLEAPGRRGYNCFDTRVAIFTGQPTLIGWVGQEEQMRYNNELTSSHTNDADAIFQTPDIFLAQKLIERYQVEYVFVGENEQQTYPSTGLMKFRHFMDAVYQDEGVTIYRRRAHAAQPAPEVTQGGKHE